MDESGLTPRVWLRRLDFALAAPGKAQRTCFACPDCGAPLEETPSGALSWCGYCRHVYFHTARRLLCEVPEHWRHERLLEYWERAMEGLRESEDDDAFARFLCRRVGASESLLEEAIAPMRDQIRMGRLALVHGLLTRGDVAWVLRFQRSARAHRRRCFGEVASALGYWEPGVVARLLAVQAERRRGLARAIASRLNVTRDRLLTVERDFFGLDEDRSREKGAAPFDALMAA